MKTMIRRNKYSDSSESYDTDESSKKNCYICEKVKKRPKKDKIIRVQRKEEECEITDCSKLYFSEPEPSVGLRFMGMGTSGSFFANGSYVICSPETVRKMSVAVKDVQPSGGFNIQMTFIYARADVNNDYTSNTTQTHISTIVQIPSSTVPLSRCAEVLVNPPIHLRQCDLVGIQINPSNTTISFQAAASLCG